MVAIVHGASWSHPLESLQQARWFRTLKAQSVQAARRFWRECEITGELRARSHLTWLADYHEGSNPELASMVQQAKDKRNDIEFISSPRRCLGKASGASRPTRVVSRPSPDSRSPAPTSDSARSPRDPRAGASRSHGE